MSKHVLTNYGIQYLQNLSMQNSGKGFHAVNKNQILHYMILMAVKGKKEYKVNVPDIGVHILDNGDGIQIVKLSHQNAFEDAILARNEVEELQRLGFIKDLDKPESVSKESNKAVVKIIEKLLSEAVSSVVSDGFYSPSALAQKHGLKTDNVRKRLNTFKGKNDSGWREVDRSSRQAQFVFQESAVIDILLKMKKRPANVQHGKKLPLSMASSKRLLEPALKN